jgi:predicted nicotinamide N-methyase
MNFDPVAFIRAQTIVEAAAIVPEIQLHLATEVTPLWQLTEERLKGSDLPPPYWAFAWPGGQGLARYILDNPSEVKDKCVIDFAAGCGIAAIAAMKAGAKQALTVDIDRLALEAVKLNAALNGVTVGGEDLIDMEKAPKRIDVILAGDVCYQQAMSARLLRWLWLCTAKGIKVIIADPGRAYVPQEGLRKLSTYTVPTSRDLEDQESRTVIVWELTPPAGARPSGDIPAS